MLSFRIVGEVFVLLIYLQLYKSVISRTFVQIPLLTNAAGSNIVMDLLPSLAGIATLGMF